MGQKRTSKIAKLLRDQERYAENGTLGVNGRSALHVVEVKQQELPHAKVMEAV